LRIAEEKADAPEALNGLQVSNSGNVSRLAAAVDLCEATIRQATEAHADFLLVHHGMFWGGGGGPRPFVGPAYARIAGLIKGNIPLYPAICPSIPPRGSATTPPPRGCPASRPPTTSARITERRRAYGASTAEPATS